MVDPQNNLPTSEAFGGNDPFKAADALVAPIFEVHESNHNLTEAEKELLRWHYCLGHIVFKKIQFLLQTGVLSQTEASRRLHSAARKVINPPKCAACQYGKQHWRPIPGTTPSTVIRDRANALKADNLLPGQRVSVDHFICSTRGRLHTSAGKTRKEDMYCGGCILVDHATGFIHVEHQVHLTSTETLQAKRNTNKFAAHLVSSLKNSWQTTLKSLPPRNLHSTSPSSNKLSTLRELALITTMVLPKGTYVPLWLLQEQ